MKTRGQDQIDLSANVIDVRDIRARIDYLESERETAKDTAEEDENAESWTAKDGTKLATSDDYGEDEEEYQTLKAAENELPREDALINEDYFKQYAQELAGDMYGREITDAKWPFNCIDWEEAAKELEQDYSAIDIDGHTFYCRD